MPEIDFPDRARMHDAGLVILQVEAYAFHQRWLAAHRGSYGADVAALLDRAAEVPRTRYVEALLEQARVRAEAEAAMEAAGVDAVLVPAVPRTAPRIGEELERGILLGFTRPFNTSGHPVITLPAPVPAGTLPVGIQVVGRFGRERELVAAALAVEASWR
jgi:Asp-tRNA(Asn)/Glu-tRNA(Gln) amidotransferase A subunit family amidase